MPASNKSAATGYCSNCASSFAAERRFLLRTSVDPLPLSARNASLRTMLRRYGTDREHSPRRIFGQTRQHLVQLFELTRKQHRIHHVVGVLIEPCLVFA